ncbi:MAG: glycosyltransferase [Synechococcus sp.]
MVGAIKLSVLMISYNHEAFISEAIDSALMQNVDYPFEIVIGDDQSTDLTRNILTDYQKRYPDTIKLIFQEKNVGPKQNQLDVLKACKGSYIALLDGDDYWDSPLKLIKASRFLDDNPQSPMCFHRIRKVFDNQKQMTQELGPKKPKKFLTTEDLLIKGGAVTSATVWRRDMLLKAATETRHIPVGDRARAIVASQFGNIGYIDEVLGVWRIHEANAFHSSSQSSPADRQIKISYSFIKLFETFDKYFSYQYHDLIVPSLTAHHYQLCEAYLSKMEWQLFATHLMQALFVPGQPDNRLLNQSIFISLKTIGKLTIKRTKNRISRKAFQIAKFLNKLRRKVLGLRARH